MPSHISYPVHCCEHDFGTWCLVQRCSWNQSRGLFKTRMGVRVDLCQHSCWELAQFHYVWGSPGALPWPVWGTRIQLRGSAGSGKLEKHMIGTWSLFHNKLYVKNEKKVRFSSHSVQWWCFHEKLFLLHKAGGMQKNWGQTPNEQGSRSPLGLCLTLPTIWRPKGQINCLACASICQVENLRPKGMKWLSQVEGELGAKPKFAVGRSSDCFGPSCSPQTWAWL